MSAKHLQKNDIIFLIVVWAATNGFFTDYSLSLILESKKHFGTIQVSEI